jgi:endonuclease YncB( thermonuclease family)
MPKPSLRSSLFPIFLVGAATALWACDVIGKSGPEPRAAAQAVTRQTGRYETHRNCVLIANRGNDGDSFLIRLPGGRSEIFRLYFVDAPESALRTYRGGRDNHARIRQQAAALGGITPALTVELGKNASAFTLGLLQSAPFTLHTRWHSPFNDQRYQAFIEVSHQGRQRLLHELLVEKGLARIHTKGAELPDGTPVSKQRTRLLDLQKAAKSDRQGAWRH